MTRIYRLPDVKQATGLSKATIYRRLAEGTFPQPVKLGVRGVGWVNTEIHMWIDGLAAAREQAPHAAG